MKNTLMAKTIVEHIEMLEGIDQTYSRPRRLMQPAGNSTPNEIDCSGWADESREGTSWCILKIG